MDRRSLFNSRAVQSAFWSALALAVWLGLAIGLVYWTAVHTVTRNQLHMMAAEAKRYAEMANRSSVTKLAEFLQMKADPGLRVRLRDADHRTLVGGVSTEAFAQAGGKATAIETAVFAQASDNRATATYAGVRVKLRDGGTLILARPLQGLDALGGRLGLVLIVGLATFAIIAFSVSYLLAQRTEKRLATLKSETERVMDGDFSQRLHVSGADDDIDGVARLVNRMLIRIEGLMASLREISDNVAHDLRTPLNRLRVRAESTLREAGDADDADRLRDGLGGVIDDADELLRTLNAMLLVARLEAGHRPPGDESFRLAQIVEDVVELYQPVADEAGGVLKADVCSDPQVMANRQLISRSLVNLVENALKYGCHGQSGNTCEVAVALFERDGKAILCVNDHGPGIAPDDRERALERFVRLDESRAKQGSGLGLSLVAAVARAYSGEFKLEARDPETGEGVSAQLVLPIVARQPEKLSGPTASYDALAG